MPIQTVKVPVVFEVEFSPASEDIVPCLVGSLKELGTWNRLNGLVARKIDEVSTKWTVELEIPQMSFFFFNWTMTKNGHFYEEEPIGCRKANVGVFGGVFKSEYGESWTEFSSFCGCHISMSTHYVLNVDEQIVVMGSGKLLGNWKTWVPAALDDPVTSVWTANFELEQGTTEEFKWVILNRQTREIRRWQEEENRIIKIETDLKNKTVFVPWGGRFVKEGLIIPDVTVGDWSDYHPQSLSRSFTIDCMIGYDDDEAVEMNNSNMEDTKLALEMVPKIPSAVGCRQYVAQKFLKANEERNFCFIIDTLAGAFGFKEVTQFDLKHLRNLLVLKTSPGQVLKAFNTEKQNFFCFTVDLSAEVVCLREFIDADVLQLQLASIAVTGPFPVITPYIEEAKRQLMLPSSQNLPSPEEPKTSLLSVKCYFNNDRTIVSRVPILDDDTDLLEVVIGHGESLGFVDKVAFLDDDFDLEDRVTVLQGSFNSTDRVTVHDGSLDLEDNVTVFGGRQDQDTVRMERCQMMEITFSDDMVRKIQNNQVVETNTKQDWSGPRQALYSVFIGLTNYCSRFVSKN
ncbi:hypothetical protein LOTGIDRAFT_172281 [Lottia gigantea]|uniref:CBM20 domain-containing protein n=1 Tax=Lottia gigantea TaxID=225164 RepID=V4B3H6_LOTGI|nr:hypothetical protein LOTGIDRAFT_172281 [Lottia gigantea]ESP01906.1 hypothetical protein LOTGIDRAFT_172281 [Lottia gigantea]